MLDSTDLEALTNGNLLGPDGAKIGRIADIYMDKDTNKPEWVLVNTGLFGTKESFVPFANATRDGDDLVVNYDKDTIKGAPHVDSDGELSEDEEAELYRYYDMANTDTTVSADHVGSQPVRSTYDTTKLHRMHGTLTASTWRTLL